jgi:DNA-binding transcriptional ArsR family regulator
MVRGCRKIYRMVKFSSLDRTLSALSDGTRREILEHLRLGPASISDLAAKANITLPGVMKHVRLLEEAELVTTKKNGRVRECRLGPGRLDDVARWIEAHRAEWERRLDRLETVLKERKGESR